jgi:hypothetical protein
MEKQERLPLNCPSETEPKNEASFDVTNAVTSLDAVRAERGRRQVIESLADLGFKRPKTFLTAE